MPAHYKQQIQYTEPHPYPPRFNRTPSSRPAPQPKSSWSSKYQQQQYSPYAPSAFANMVGSFTFAEPDRHYQPHLSRAPSSRQPSTSTSRYYSHAAGDRNMPNPNAYSVLAPSPPKMAASVYTTSPGSGSGSSPSISSILASGGSNGGGSAAVWSPLRQWTEGACTVNRDRLVDYCQANDLPEPMYKTYSDRRGGRTAWSCSIALNPNLEIPARLWFDGKYVENAGEDAADRAWNALMASEKESGCV